MQLQHNNNIALLTKRLHICVILIVTLRKLKTLDDIILPLAIVTNGSIIYVIENIYLAQTM